MKPFNDLNFLSEKEKKNFNFRALHVHITDPRTGNLVYTYIKWNNAATISEYSYCPFQDEKCASQID